MEKLSVALKVSHLVGEKRRNELFFFTILWKTVFDGVGLDFLSKMEISLHITYIFRTNV